MGVSIDGGTPKSSISMWCSTINHHFLCAPIYGNPHMCVNDQLSRLLVAAGPFSQEKWPTDELGVFSLTATDPMGEKPPVKALMFQFPQFFIRYSESNTSKLLHKWTFLSMTFFQAAVWPLFLLWWEDDLRLSKWVNGCSRIRVSNRRHITIHNQRGWQNSKQVCARHKFCWCRLA